MTICSRFLTFSLPKFLTESYSPLRDLHSLTLGQLLSCAGYSILSIDASVIPEGLEAGGFSLNQNCTLVRMFSFLTLPAGDGSGCRHSQMNRMSNSRRTGSVKSFRRLLHVSIGYA